MRGGANLNIVPLIKKNYFINLNDPNHFYALIKTLDEMSDYFISEYAKDKESWVRYGEPGVNCDTSECQYMDQFGNEVVSGKYRGVREWEYIDPNPKHMNHGEFMRDNIPAMPKLWKALEIDEDTFEIDEGKVEYSYYVEAEMTLKLIYHWLDQPQNMNHKSKKESVMKPRKVSGWKPSWKHNIGKKGKQFYEVRRDEFLPDSFHYKLYNNIVDTFTLTINFNEVITLIKTLAEDDDDANNINV